MTLCLERRRSIQSCCGRVEFQLEPNAPVTTEFPRFGAFIGDDRTRLQIPNFQALNQWNVSAGRRKEVQKKNRRRGKRRAEQRQEEWSPPLSAPQT